MAKTTTKKQALRAFRDALERELGPLGHMSSVRRFERCFAAALRKTLEAAPAVSIPGLGTFRRTTRKARRVHNLTYQPGESRPMRHLVETHSVRFSPCGEWRRSLK